MPLFVCGINHKSAPVALREKIAFSSDTLSVPLRNLIREEGVEEVVILSTCNRTELYCVGEDPLRLYAWLQKHHDITAEELGAAFYVYEGRAAVIHAMRVACGLDSMVIGEPQILGQFKLAFTKAYEYQTVGQQFKRLFPRIFSVAKRVRTHTALGACPASLASMVVKCAHRSVSSLLTSRVLVLGAGETGLLAVKHLYEDGVRQLIVASRQFSRAQQITDRYAGIPIELIDTASVLASVDVIVSATGSPVPILNKEIFEKALPQGRSSSIMIFDIAVPRDVDEEVKTLDYVTLFSLDELQTMIQQHWHDRQHAAEKASEMIEREATEFFRWQDSLDAGNAIKLYRDYVNQLCEEELSKAKCSLLQGEDPTSVLTQFARVFTKKLMHKPSVNLRKAGYAGRIDLLELTELLFEIESVS